PDGTRTDISAIPYNHPVGVVEQQGLPSFSLMQNAPNPFNPSTTIRFTLPEAGHVTLAVYDINGRLVRTLVGQAFLPGHHEVVWDGKDAMGRAVASGVYVYRLTAAQGVVTRRMTLLR
ncbi:MAG TPA: FlgD immunoglobulin-like domain containing protein, partial [Candidatus Latescibacteria bacterium]|nr:FlgD immunoglobulin-like domain containing protein [Candidatus Latescibacterota bacterium]HPK75755.1 FlgD immunoglobulin-like domain containing protein [Candidatus Latescibacterota bacterium]